MLPCTQQQGTLFTITRWLYTLTNNSGRYWCWKLPRLLLLWFVWGLSDVHECISGLKMAPSPLDKQTAGCNLPHNWLITMAMNWSALCDTWSWKWHQWMSFVCSQCWHSLYLLLCGSPPPPTFAPIEVFVVFAMLVKNYLKQWAIQLAIHSTVGS